MSSKKRASSTDAENLAMFAMKMPKRSMRSAMYSFMDECEPAAYELLDHLRKWNVKEIEIDEQSRLEMVIKSLVDNRPTLSINLEDLPTYKNTPNVEEGFSIYYDYFKNSKKSVSLVSVHCFGKYLDAAIADSNTTISGYLEKANGIGQLKMGICAAKNRHSLYKFMQQYPMIVNSNIGYGFLTSNLVVYRQLFGYIKDSITVSTDKRYAAWCSHDVSNDELYVILSA